MAEPQLKATMSHEVRTAAEPRQTKMYTVRVAQIEQINPSVRPLRLTFTTDVQAERDIEEETDRRAEEPFSFLAGQWLDVRVPSVRQAGGFTLTSTPEDAATTLLPEYVPAKAQTISGDRTIAPKPMDPRGRAPYLELAVQQAPSNPVAEWLWRPAEEIVGRELSVRVGGSFVWPPASIDVKQLKRVVFVAGGVGINPLISILSHLHNSSTTPGKLPLPMDIHILYSTRMPELAPPPPETTTSTEAILEHTLFVSRVREIMRSQAASRRLQITFELFLTDIPDQTEGLSNPPEGMTIWNRRIDNDDLRRALNVSGTGTAESESEQEDEESRTRAKEVVCYVCGPPPMADEIVTQLRQLLHGVDDKQQRVFCERWW